MTGAGLIAASMVLSPGTGVRGVFGAGASVAGTVASASVSGAGAQAGDIGYAVFTRNAGSGVTLGTPSGWTAVGNLTAATTSRVYLFKRTMDGTETTISATWSASGKWCLSGIVLSGALLGPDASATDTDLTTDTAYALPAVTPTVDGALLVGLIGSWHDLTNVATSLTPPTGWTLQRNDQSTVATTGRTETSILTKQLTAGAGVAQGPSSGTWDTQAPTSAQWALSIAPS